jgi:hypothetical protein
LKREGLVPFEVDLESGGINGANFCTVSAGALVGAKTLSVDSVELPSESLTATATQGGAVFGS